MEIKALLVKDYVEDRLDQMGSDIYHIECIIHLCLHTFQYGQMRNKIAKMRAEGKEVASEITKKHKKKFWTIIKYICDCYTSHDKFSRKFYKACPKKIAIVGMTSSVINSCIAWSSY